MTDLTNLLRNIWFLGDVHGSFKHVAQAVLDAQVKPTWLVFLGDLEIEARTFTEVMEPLNRNFPDVRVAFIHGNHDADDRGLWKNLHASGSALPLHGKVVDLDGVRVAGLGGNFISKVHGHTHSSVNFRLGDSKRQCRVVANPRGFPFWQGLFEGQFENKAFRDDLLVGQDEKGHWSVLK